MMSKKGMIRPVETKHQGRGLSLGGVVCHGHGTWEGEKKGRGNENMVDEGRGPGPQRRRGGRKELLFRRRSFFRIYDLEVSVVVTGGKVTLGHAS